MMVPAAYALEMATRRRDGFAVINLKRLIFYLSRPHTAEVCAGTASLTQYPPQSIVQNLEAGGSLGVDYLAYDALGGFDEDFVGWGGEDNEFWERALTGAVYPFGYLPIVHLWHPPQPEKLLGAEALGARRYRELCEDSPLERIKRLRARAVRRG
jgi:GT2 family glycosyltransferase